MPKIVDHEAKRREISEAVWRVVRRDGLDGASVRAVATEAGMSTGAMRHYFAGHAELQLEAMRALTDRVAVRIQALEPAGTVADQAIAMLREVLPLDAERRAETDVWFAFVAKAASQPSFQAVADASYDALHALVGQVVLALRPTASEADLAVETERLFALVDGLVLHAVQRPDRMTAAVMAAVLERHVADLAAG